MILAGYTAKEIVKAAGGSESYVYRRKKVLKQEGSKPKDSLRLIQLENTIAVLNIFFAIEMGFEMEDMRKYMIIFIKDRVIEFMEKIFLIDRDFGKAVNDSSDYYKNIKQTLSQSNDTLDKDASEQRRKWIALLKKNYPEKLAELIK